MHHPNVRPHRRLAGLALAALLALSASGLSPRAQDPPEEAPAEQETAPALQAAEATVLDLEWLSGEWRGSGLGGEIEEIWSRPAGGSLMGMFRLVAEGKTALYEFLLIEETPRGVQLTFRHYGQGHRAWERDAPLSFLLVHSSPGRAEFKSEHQRQSPARMVYSLQESEKGPMLSVVVENPEFLPEPRSFEVHFRRVAEPAQR